MNYADSNSVDYLAVLPSILPVACIYEISILLHQHLRGNMKGGVQLSYHFQAKFPLSIQNLADPAFETQDLGKIFELRPHLLYPELDSPYRIGQTDGQMLAFAGVDHDREYF